MKGLNKVTLIGKLGKAPEVQTLETGIILVKFSSATSESYKDREGCKANPNGMTQRYCLAFVGRNRRKIFA